MRQAIQAGQQPQQILDLRAHTGYGIAVQVTKGQTASGIRIDTDPTILMSGGGITLDPAVDATHSGGSFTFPRFSDRLYAVVDTGNANIFIDVMKWKVEGDFDPRKQHVYSGFETKPISGAGTPQPK